jgi:hypothetical protein
MTCGSLLARYMSRRCLGDFNPTSSTSLSLYIVQTQDHGRKPQQWRIARISSLTDDRTRSSVATKAAFQLVVSCNGRMKRDRIFRTAAAVLTRVSPTQPAEYRGITSPARSPCYLTSARARRLASKRTELLADWILQNLSPGPFGSSSVVINHHRI